MTGDAKPPDGVDEVKVAGGVGTGFRDGGVAAFALAGGCGGGRDGTVPP
jgi:hypothetical protein